MMTRWQRACSEVEVAKIDPGWPVCVNEMALRILAGPVQGPATLRHGLSSLPTELREQFLMFPILIARLS